MKSELIVDVQPQEISIALTEDDRLQEGEVIWLKKKQTKASKEYKGRTHHVRSGESMYTIAQKYGIRLKSLYKMNKLSPDYEIQVGDELKLR